MGYTLDTGGKPVFAATPTQTVADLQAAVDFAKKHAFDRAGTAADRALLPVGQTWPGLTWYETDTGALYQAITSTTWRLLFLPMTAWTPTVTGLTLGNGSLRTFYTQSDLVVTFFIEMESGSTTVATGGVSFSLPVPVADVAMHRHVGEGYFRYTGGAAGAWPVEPRLTGLSVVNASFIDTSGGLATPGGNLTNVFPTSGAWSGATLRPSLYLRGTYRTT